MKYLYKALPKPARLYIKQCPHCGLKYFGKSERENIHEYKGSGVRWSRHLAKHNVEPVHLWNSDWYYDTSISRFATKFSNINKVVERDQWANLAIENGFSGGYLGEEVNKKISKILNDPGWKSTTGKQRSQNHSNTITDSKWLEDVGYKKYKQQAQSLSDTMNDPLWKKTIGRQRIDKMLETKSSTEWKETIGKNAYEQASKSVQETKNNKEWKETVGKQASKKQSQTLNDKEWQETLGKKKIEKMLNTKNTREWQETVGKEWKQKLSNKRNDPEWLETVGKESYARGGRARSAIFRSEEYKKKNYKTCSHCGWYGDPGNYAKHHEDKCKKKDT
jgi:SOS response regulatory protein OraA/RecX